MASTDEVQGKARPDGLNEFISLEERKGSAWNAEATKFLRQLEGLRK